MGMSSSQARLLSLTARQHDIEYKAQKIEAQKLQLANESDRVYDDYIRALDANKLQYKAINSDGSTTFKDATLNAMENGIISDWTGETSSKTLFLQDQDGKILVTPAIATKYGLSSTQETRDMDTFIEETTGKTKSTRDIYGTRMVEDPDSVVSFTKITNVKTAQPKDKSNHTYNPIENIEGGIDYEALKGYAEFNDSHTASTSGATEITGSTTSIAAGTYTISSAEGLQKFAQLYTSGTNVNIILTGDIDMSGVTGWTGINGYTGTFDGNGYKISNLSGTNGLFASTSSATVKNVGLENLNITGNSAYVGGLIGYASQTNISNCYTTGSIKNSNTTTDTPDYTETSGTQKAGTGGLVGGTFVYGETISYNNVYSSADVQGSNSVGGLLGSLWVDYSGTDFNLQNCYGIGNVNGTTHVGGLIGRAWYDQDSGSTVTDIKKAYSGGNVQGSTNVGGFAGDFLYWGDYESQACLLDSCVTSSTVSGSSCVGGFIGKLHIKNASADDSAYKVMVKDSGYNVDCGVSNDYGMVEDTNDPGTDVRDTYLDEEGTGSLLSFKLAGSIPSMTDFAKNIEAALVKAGGYDPCHPDTTEAQKTQMNNYINAYLNQFSNDKTDNSKLWYLNIAICDYLENGGSAGVGTGLVQDIVTNSGTTTTGTASFLTGDALDGKVQRSVDTEQTVLSSTHEKEKGKVTIPALNNIIDQIYLMYKQNNNVIEKSTISNWINAKYNVNSNADMCALANLNDAIQASNLTDIQQAINNNTQYSDGKYTDEDWNAQFGSEKTITITHGQKPEQYVTGHEQYWDTTDPDIANAMSMYYLAKRGVTVVTAEQAASQEYITNMVEGGWAVFTTFEPENMAQLINMSEEQINAMTDAEYNEMLGIENTNVSTNTSLREVADETDLKKAEAKYEADMKRIDRKDAKYDTQLAKLETERGAIKEEIETLETVAKENAERTFKLFS